MIVNAGQAGGCLWTWLSCGHGLVISWARRDAPRKLEWAKRRGDRVGSGLRGQAPFVGHDGSTTGNAEVDQTRDVTRGQAVGDSGLGSHRFGGSGSLKKQITVEFEWL
jgi:hypothetical protein